MNIRKLTLLILLFSFILLPFSSQAFAKGKKKKTVRNVEIQTKDEMILTGTLTMPETASINNKVPVVILLHSLGSNRYVYDKLASSLKAKNIATLAIDSRGHGASTTKLSGKRTYWQNYANKTFAKYPTDIAECIDFLKEHYVAINVSRVGIVAADVNANAAILLASKNSYGIKSMVLLSPTLSFKGLSTPQPLMNYKSHPIIIIVTQNDIKHYKDAKVLEKYANGKVTFITTKTGGTGDNILKLNPYLNSSLTTWFSKNL